MIGPLQPSRLSPLQLNITIYIEHFNNILRHWTIKSLEIAIPKLSEINEAILNKVKLSKTIFPKEYEESKRFYQQKLENLQYELFKKTCSMIIVFESCDVQAKEEIFTVLLKS